MMHSTLFFQNLLSHVQLQLEEIAQRNSQLNALITPPNGVEIVERLHAYKEKYPQTLLQGMTVSIKDNIDTACSYTTAGAEFWRYRQPDQDAEVISRLKNAGAVIFGKANMTELAWGVRSYSAVGGQCLNPLDIQRIAGGSSGGSAASVAASFCDASLGTDTGGSIRIPAAFCGLVGLRPTYGGIPNTGVLPLSHSHDTIGIIGNSAYDVARLYTAIAGPCPLDTTSNNQRPSSVLAKLGASIEGLRIGIPQHYYYDHCTSEIVEAVLAAAGLLEKRGAVLVPVVIESAEKAQAMASCMMASEVSALYQHRIEQNPISISKDIRERIQNGFNHTGMDYARALRFKREWQLILRQLYAHVDLTLIPATSTTAPLLNDSRSLLEATKDLARNTYPSALAGIPSLAVPCGQDSDGLPIGLLLESAWGREDILLRCAAALVFEG